MTLWFLVTRLLVHHTGEASSSIHTTSPYAYTDSNTEMHEHEQSRGLQREKRSGQIFSLLFLSWIYREKLFEEVCQSIPNSAMSALLGGNLIVSVLRFYFWHHAFEAAAVLYCI